MGPLDNVRALDLKARRTGAEYLNLYQQFKDIANEEDNGPLDVLRRGGEVLISEGSVYGEGPSHREQVALSYQRPDVIAKESLVLKQAAISEGNYKAETLEFGQEGSLLKVTQSQDTTRDQYGDEMKTVLYVDPTTGALFSSH
ncbi:MAG: hypothetical protein WC314_12750 [Vulcanimicrobiota bacterium]